MEKIERISRNQSIFQVFGIEESVDINQDELDARYAALINQMHPDKFINYTLDRKIAEENTSIINEYYKILISPRLLYEYLLSVQESESQIVELDMFDMMELYTELACLDSIGKATSFKYKVENLWNQTLQNIRKNIINRDFSRGTINMQRLKFLEKLLKSAKQKEFELSHIENEITSNI